MTTCVALVRGINVGGHNRVAMQDLRGLGERLGLEDVRSLLQSGNLVFRSDSHDTGQLEQRLEREAEKRLRLKVAFFVRTADEWASLVRKNPFRDEAERDPGHLLAVLMKRAPKPAAVAELRAAIAAIKGPEQVEARGRDAYFYYPAGVGRSKLTLVLIEKTLGGNPGTARNWNTVLKILSLMHSSRA
jgi:uncharacterized protein (DUF1697 family)